MGLTSRLTLAQGAPIRFTHTERVAATSTLRCLDPLGSLLRSVATLTRPSLAIRTTACRYALISERHHGQRPERPLWILNVFPCLCATQRGLSHLALFPPFGSLLPVSLISISSPWLSPISVSSFLTHHAGQHPATDGHEGPSVYISFVSGYFE